MYGNTVLALAGVLAVCVALTIAIRRSRKQNTPNNIIASESPLGTVEVVYTTADKKLCQAGRLSWHASTSLSSEPAIVANSHSTFQKWRGVGFAFTDAACFEFVKLPEAELNKLLGEMFDPAQLGFSIGRVCVGSSDYATKVYNCCPGQYDPDILAKIEKLRTSSDPEIRAIADLFGREYPAHILARMKQGGKWAEAIVAEQAGKRYAIPRIADPELKTFNIEHDKQWILPVLTKAREFNPNLFLLASPWSPPAWMKANNSMWGGAMQRKWLGTYAQYFLKFLQAYQAEGIHIDALTTQNEVDAEQDGNMPACAWPQELEVDFVAQFMGPALEKAGMSTEIWAIDHNYNLWGRALGSLDDVNFRKYCKSIAWHGYFHDSSKMAVVHDAHPEVSTDWTEGGPDYSNADYATDHAKWASKITGIARNWSRSFIAWNGALDEIGQPNIGPFPCGGVVTIDSKTNEIRRSGQFWAMAQFSKFVKQGAVRIDTQGAFDGVDHVAFKNPDGSTAMVLTNSKGATTVQVKVGSMVTSVKLEADSVTSLTWQ